MNDIGPREGVPSPPSPTGLFHGAPAYQPLTSWPPLLAVVVSVLIVLASTLLLFSGAAVARLAGLIADRWDTAELVGLGLWQALTVALTLVAAGMLGGRPRDALALGRPVATPLVYVKALLLMAALQVVVSLVQHSYFRQDMYADLRPFVRLFNEHWLLALLIVGVGAPLSEELLFRGFLQSALTRSRLGFWGGALITTSLWTVLHAGYSKVGIAEVFLIGMFLSWLLWRTGSLRVTIVCHAVYNSLVVVTLRYVPLPAPS